MIEIIIKALSFVLVIATGAALRAKGLCTREHGKFLSAVVINITLPCSILSSVKNVELTPVLLLALAIGLSANLLTNFIGYAASRGETPMNRALSMINTSGFNVGGFALPFIQSIFPESYIIYICMFDMGNSFMCTGGTYAIASSVSDASGNRPTVGGIFRKLFSSVPFCTYIMILILSIFKISLPSPILTVTEIAAKANAFLAMLVIGILLELKFDMSEKKMIKRILASRYFIAVTLSLLVYFFLPADIVVRKMIVIGLMAPVSAVAPVFSARLGSDSPVPAAINSITIIVSTCILTILMIFFA